MSDTKDMNEEMEMPTPCQRCGEIFDLHDGYTSVRWYPNTVICNDCGWIEESEIEKDEEIVDLKLKLENALFDAKSALEELHEIGAIPCPDMDIEDISKIDKKYSTS